MPGTHTKSSRVLVTVSNDALPESAPATLQILYLEDEKNDVALANSLLLAGGFECEFVHVWSRNDFITALDKQRPDIIFADYKLPGFDGWSALKIARQKCPDVPFIFLSGTLGEELAIESLKNGATDYVLKNNMQRLVPAVRRALSEVKERRERLLAEQKMQQYLHELQRSNESLERFTSIISHDLKEPLRMISSYLSLLEKRYKTELDATALKFIQIAVDGAKRMQHMISDLLEFSQLSRRQTQFTKVDCNKIVEEALQNLSVAIKESKANIHCEELPEVNGDPYQLIQVFQNLVGNALKFSAPTTPVIRIGASQGGGYWKFRIEDNGIGIDPQFAERIFQIFQRLHNKKEYPGTGIGLSICKNIIENHGGRIWVEPNAGKAGTTFFFTLPQ